MKHKFLKILTKKEKSYYFEEMVKQLSVYNIKRLSNVVIFNYFSLTVLWILYFKIL